MPTQFISFQDEPTSKLNRDYRSLRRVRKASGEFRFSRSHFLLRYIANELRRRRVSPVVQAPVESQIEVRRKVA